MKALDRFGALRGERRRLHPEPPQARTLYSLCRLQQSSYARILAFPGSGSDAFSWGWLGLPCARSVKSYRLGSILASAARPCIFFKSGILRLQILAFF